MKIFRNIFICLFLIGIIAYLSIIFVLPYFLNKKDFSYIFSDAVKKQINLNLVIKKGKVHISPTLNITFDAENIAVYYPETKKQILDIKKAKADISTLSLLNKEIKLQALSAEKFQLSLKLLKNGRFSIDEYIEKNLKADNNQQLKFSNEIPNIKINEAIIKVKDEKTEQKFKFHDKKIRLSKGLIPTHSQFISQGEFFCFNKKYFNYKIKISFPTEIIKEFKLKPIKISVDNLEKYKIHADIDSDLKIVKNKNHNLYGHINIDNFSMYSAGTKLPPSFFHITFKENKGELASQFFTAPSEKADIKAKFNITDSPRIYLSCNTKKISLKNLKPVLVTITDILSIKTNLNEFNLSGYLTSDFEVDTDLKSVESHGKLKVVNASIQHKEIPLKITQINADVDFSDNQINIKKSGLLVNSQPVELKGTIDKNAYGNITLSADNLNLNHIMNAFPILKPSKDLNVKSGILSFSAELKGNLNKAVPKVNAEVKNFSALKNKDLITIDKITADLKNANEKKFNGILNIFNLKYIAKDLPSSLYAAKISGDINEKDFILLPSKFTYEKAVLTVKGSIKDYAKTPEAQLTVFGTVDTNFLKTQIPSNVKMYSAGVLPLGATIHTKNNLTQIQANVLSTANAYITPVMMKNMGSTLLHLDALIKNNNLEIIECSLNYPPSSIKLSDNIDTTKLKKILEVKGEINNISNPSLKDLKIRTGKILTFSYEPVSSTGISADIMLNGKVQAPQIEGNISLSDIQMPMVYIKKLDIIAQKNLVKVQISTAKIEDTFINLEAIAQSDFLATKKITNLNLNAEKIDLENLMKLSALLPQSQFAPGNESPFDVLSGKLSVKNIKLNTLKLQNLTSDLKIEKNIMYLNNLRANAYRGNIAANVQYDFSHITTKATIQARGLESSMAAVDILPVDPHISGKLNFDSQITMAGLTQEQQMKTLKGNANVLVTGAMLGPLGRFEHFLHAQNLLSQKLIYASLNSAKRAIAPKNTGYVDSLKGVLTFSNGTIHISPLTTAGPQMSMLVTGVVNMLTGTVDLQILGKVSPDVSDSVGLLGDVTIKNILDEHTTYGPVVANLFNSYNTELPEIDISRIPALTSKYATDTKNFRVLIGGDPESIKSIKSFTWVNPIGTRAELLKRTAIIKPNPEKAEETRLKQIIQTKTRLQNKQESQNTVDIQVQQPEKQVKPAGFLDNIPDNFK